MGALLTRIGIALWIGLLIVGCGSATETGTPGTARRGFEIYVFDARSTGYLGDSGAEVWHALTTLDLATSASTMTDQDLLTYHWSAQTITITNPWGVTTQDVPGFLSYGGGYVVVVFEGHRLFGGAVAPYGTARRIDFPVMLYDGIATLRNDSKTLVYRFHPSADPRLTPPLEFLAEDAATAERVRAYFRAAGKLQD